MSTAAGGGAIVSSLVGLSWILIGLIHKFPEVAIPLPAALGSLVDDATAAQALLPVCRTRVGKAMAWPDGALGSVS